MAGAIYEEGVGECCQDSSDGLEKCGCVTDIVARIGLAPSTVSHHLKELARAGLVKVERNGQSVRIVAEPCALVSLKKFAEDMLALT